MRNIVVILLIIIICVTKKSYYFFFSIQCYLKKKKNSLEFSHKTHQNKKTAPSAPQHPTFSKKICPVELGDQAKTLSFKLPWPQSVCPGLRKAPFANSSGLNCKTLYLIPPT